MDAAILLSSVTSHLKLNLNCHHFQHISSYNYFAFPLNATAINLPSYVVKNNLFWVSISHCYEYQGHYL